MSLVQALPKAILFDADGTLYDSEYIQYESNRLTAKDLHDFNFTWEIFDVHVRRGGWSGFTVLEAAGHTVDRDNYLALKLNYFRKLVVERLEPQPGLIEFLKWCKAKHMRLGIVSASRRNQLLFALDTLGLSNYFEVLVSMEDIIDRRPKPDPAPYLLGLERLAASPIHVLAVEDTLKGITSARAAKMTCVAIRNSTNTEGELKTASYIINDYQELKDYLLRQ